MVKRGGDGEAGKYGGSLSSNPSHVLTNIRFGVGLLFFIGVLAELKEYEPHFNEYSQLTEHSFVLFTLYCMYDENYFVFIYCKGMNLAIKI